jgi:hypothetical protein
MGRPAHMPDPMLRRQVEAMAGYGVTEAQIAGLIGIDTKTLRKHYRNELDHGHVKANVKVAENLFRKATGEGREAVTAAIFWMKARAQWREVSLHQHDVATHEPVTVIRRIIVSPSPNGDPSPSDRLLEAEDLRRDHRGTRDWESGR